MIPASDLYFLFAFPVVLLLVFGFLMFGRGLEPEKRQRVERIMAAIVYPVITVFWFWKSYEYALKEHWAFAVGMLGVGLIFTLNGVRAVREGRLAPRKRAR
ncbi:hypothetical protein [Brevundimonas sp. Root1279]|uniref:hypothetical protein n=1 Tax=Brevundimonas sp. Root1279 TaxID=1736443 RepID=UPI0006FD6B83|nr:hypothetical protein [Brevundimonas sp. Root1279]KQW79554.1 hypothetical protein ASC65_13370 [Brevundimonas sp. Root1279]